MGEKRDGRWQRVNIGVINDAYSHIFKDSSPKD
jgi:hypothetical protein